MIDTKALRGRVLDLAIQGKLTEQLESDGTAEELWQQIQAEKLRLIQAGKIKREKPLSEISEDEIPFEIPENWKWVRFSSIITLQSGQDLQKDEYNDNHNGIPYMTGASNYNADGSLLINRWTDAPKALAEKGDILLSCKGTVGKIAILSIEKAHIARQIMGIRVYISDNAFISLFVQSKVNGIIAASKGLIPGIERKDVLNMAIPLPPLSEQKRIVARVEEIFRLLDIIDSAQEQYAADAESLKAKLITLGIQGRLTEQLASDGTAEELYQQIQAEKQRLIKEGRIKREKPLPEITPDEIPFEIPGNWKYCYLNDIAYVTKLAGFEYTSTIAPNISTQGIPLFKGKNIQDGQLVLKFESFIPPDVSDSLPRSQLRKKCLLTPYVGTIGNIAIFDGSFAAHLGSNVGKIELFNDSQQFILEEYVLLYLRSKAGKKQLSKFKKATAQDSISIEAIRNTIIPLPPLAEQKRIAETLERALGVVR